MDPAVAASPPRHRVLLIGIDAYGDGANLFGCVRDIDAVQSFLVERGGVPPASILRMVAEHPRSPGQAPLPAATDPATRPTRQNILGALRELASDSVQPGDRVLIYYSGHGTSIRDEAAGACFEALVPVDHADDKWVLDYELNPLLHAIARRSQDLTVVLDCCHSGGVTRSSDEQGRARFLPVSRVTLPPLPAARAPAGILPSTPAGLSAFTVVAACHASETAREIVVDEGNSHGALTYVLLQLLCAREAALLKATRWIDLWQPLKAGLSARGLTQHPVLLGQPERPILGGAFSPYDAGFAVLPVPGEPTRASLFAGLLGGLTREALVAVYGPLPPRFPELDARGEDPLRLCTLRVEATTPVSATASVFPSGSLPALPAGARGRLVRMGPLSPLRVYLEAGVAPEVKQGLASSDPALLTLVESAADAEARIGAYPDGGLWIGDDLNGAGPPLRPEQPGPLGCVPAQFAGAPLPTARRVEVLRAALAHYAQYVVPLRLFRSGGETLPAGSLVVQILDCDAAAQLTSLGRDPSQRHEAPIAGSGHYLLRNGARICMQIQNLFRSDLYVSLILCTLSGRVQVLETDLRVAAGATEWCWNDGLAFAPFEMFAPEDRGWGIERLIAVATDQPGHDLRYLDQEDTLQEIIVAALRKKSLVRRPKQQSGLRWTALQRLIQVGIPPLHR